MKETPLVSIIIPTYNRAHLIGETLDSIITQTYSNWECILVDDGSTDNSRIVLDGYCKKDTRFKYIQRPNERLKGGNAARNYGFENCKGDYIQWFDSDDIMLPLFLESKIENLGPEIMLNICTGYSVDENLSNKKLKKLPEITNLFKDYVLWKSRIMPPSIIFNRKVLEGRSLYDETLLRGQENDFFSRMFFTIKAEDYSITNKALYLYRQHRNTKSFEDKNTYRSDYKKSMGRVSLSNLKRGLQINDLDIVNYHYRIVIHYLFEAILNKDSRLARFFLSQLISIFKLSYPLFVLELVFFIPTFIVCNRTLYNIEKRFKRKVFL
ncbi:glycosyltransferase family 2 protein [Winogradskyella helgolandensis]|uniref:glycosyltransferase family 2 protein n=1 Tax=Winogradskyella helgolandensis TaxID=2697010 RepID=UPI0015B99BC6|nr:glycosyltransferase family 2 protein [Winogradskyella helgolandensis]